MNTPDKMIFHARAIVGRPSANQHDAVLLDIVSLARDGGRDLPSIREPYTGRLSFARVGLLGARNADFEADSLHLGAAAGRREDR
jgi:hypothetical protein